MDVGGLGMTRGLLTAYIKLQIDVGPAELSNGFVLIR